MVVFWRRRGRAAWKGRLVALGSNPSTGQIGFPWGFRAPGFSFTTLRKVPTACLQPVWVLKSRDGGTYFALGGANKQAPETLTCRGPRAGEILRQKIVKSWRSEMLLSAFSTGYKKKKWINCTMTDVLLLIFIFCLKLGELKPPSPPGSAEQ